MITKALREEKCVTAKKILVVDDYPPTRNLIVEALIQSSKYQIDEAENGEEALRLFGKNNYDLVISDIMMPGISGMELLNRLREANPDTAVIMITGSPSTDLTVNAIKKGAADFLTKPFDIDELLYKVDIHLREKAMLKEENADKAQIRDGLKDKTSDLSKKSYIYDSIEESPADNEAIFDRIAELALKLVDGDVCSVYLFDEQDRDFYPEATKGDGDFQLSPAVQKVFKEVIERREAVVINSSEHADLSPSLICAPLMIRNAALGILSVRKKKNREVFNRTDLSHILSLTKRASLNLENKILYESIYSNIMDTLQSLVSSIQARDHYTEEHSKRVTEMAVKIAASLNCSIKEQESIKIAGILHDVGKIAVPDSILLKPGGLTAEEYLVIKNHPNIGENILKPVMLLEKERKIVQCHHERYDGKGYPLGLTGSDIPFLSRILAVADSLDAMTNNRPYRQAMDIEKAIRELNKNRGLQFDGDVVEALIKIL